MSTTQTTDKALGIGVALVGLAVAGALVSLVAPGTQLGAWGFAAAMTLGALAIAAVHVFG